MARAEWPTSLAAVAFNLQLVGHCAPLPLPPSPPPDAVAVAETQPEPVRALHEQSKPDVSAVLGEPPPPPPPEASSSSSS